MRRLKAHYGRGRKLNQMRKVQFSANSGAVTVDERETAVEEMVLTGLSGNVQITAVKTRIEN